MKAITLANDERIFTEKRTALFRKEQFDYVHTGIVDGNGEMWTTTELDEVNLNQVLNQYRAKYGVPFPDEIVRLREYYGISAAKMSEILGFGINQYRYYEDGEMPSISNARTIVAIRDKKVFLDFLNASRNVLSSKDYQKISQRVEALPEFVKSDEVPSSRNGYVSRSVNKLRAVMLYFIEKMQGVYVTKMNKLLFYSDFLTYKRTGFGLTGLEYTAMQYGPVPTDWGRVYGNIPDISMNESIVKDSATGIKLESEIVPDLSILSQAERDVLDAVCGTFFDASARQISNASHQERGWIENEKRKGVIDYAYAFDLSL